MRSKVFSAMAIGLALPACAGRDPEPIASVQPQDVYADCTMLRAEIEANNVKIKELADEQGVKAAQNVIHDQSRCATFPSQHSASTTPASARLRI